MVTQMNRNVLVAIKVFKWIWTFMFVALDIALTIGSDGRSTGRHSPLKAQLLHEDGLISDAEYMRSLRGDS